MRWNLLLAVTVCMAMTAMLGGAENRMTPELLWKLGRIGGISLSSDGAQVAYTVWRCNLKENEGKTSLYIYDVASKSQKALLSDWNSISSVQFAPSPFGERIYFAGRSGKQNDESTQVWTVNPVDGGVYQVTDWDDESFFAAADKAMDDEDGKQNDQQVHSNEKKEDEDGKKEDEKPKFGGIGNLKVAPTGTHIAFTTRIKIDKKVTELYEDLPKANARLIDSLMFRHWNAWHDYKYSHLHVAELDESGRAKGAVDLMHGMRVDCPVPPFGGSEQYAWSPDGKQIALTLKDVERWAESTDSDVYLVDIENPGALTNISQGMTGYDNDPSYSPDGKWIAFHSMERPGFESDRLRIMIYDRATAKITEATQGLDQQAHGAEWTDDSKSLLFGSEFRGTTQLFRLKPSGGEATQVSKGRFNWGLHALLPGGDKAIVSFTNMLRPMELAIMNLADGSTETMTDVNGEIYADLELPTIEERWIEATDGKSIHNWVIYPPGFDESKEYPMLTYCQGGPQGQIGQWFSYRWNFHLMASQGYVVLAPNRRGLPGFGREWNDQISGDWGGQAMDDLLSATDEMLEESYIDEKRTGAIGASFGGYTVYWMMGHAQDRFACMLAHCGVFNLESMYGSTEELFFVNWDLGGPYWKSPKIREDYRKFSPHNYVQNWSTPLLVVHGQRDFRVPVTQGMEAFTAAQVQGVPSKFLYFPEEGHWVMGPQNGVLWHRVFFEWLDEYCKD